MRAQFNGNSRSSKLSVISKAKYSRYFRSLALTQSILHNLDLLPYHTQLSLKTSFIMQTPNTKMCPNQCEMKTSRIILHSQSDVYFQHISKYQGFKELASNYTLDMALVLVSGPL